MKKEFKSLREYAIENGQEYLIKEWDRERNGEVTPSTIAFDSERKIWWRKPMSIQTEGNIEICWVSSVAQRTGMVDELVK